MVSCSHTNEEIEHIFFKADVVEIELLADKESGQNLHGDAYYKSYTGGTIIIYSKFSVYSQKNGESYIIANKRIFEDIRLRNIKVINSKWSSFSGFHHGNYYRELEEPVVDDSVDEIDLL